LTVCTAISSDFVDGETYCGERRSALDDAAGGIVKRIVALPSRGAPADGTVRAALPPPPHAASRTLVKRPAMMRAVGTEYLIGSRSVPDSTP
jgi:hypothetical protein